MLWHKDQDLSMFHQDDCILLPGGFSYGDYLRCGAIARFSPMMKAVAEFAGKGGKVLGVCNGFQVLCEAGLLPGALLMNKARSFICKNIYVSYSGVAGSAALKIPIAHGEGRYYADEATLDALEVNGQVVFRYSTPDGTLSDASNPNGSARHIAGIRNSSGNVFGMMPHPERATDPLLGNLDGRKAFRLLGLI